MKKTVSIIMILSLLAVLFGCKQAAEPEMIMPTSFYYHNNLDEKEDFDNVFVKEIREGSHYHNNYVSMLNSYIAGPKSEYLVNPFPSELSVISFDVKDESAYIVLSDEISKLNSIDLTMACSCLSLTLFELTQCNYVQISAENELISGQNAVVIAKNSLVLSDETELSPAD